MTSHDKQPHAASADRQLDAERINSLLFQLEQELGKLPADTPHLDNLRKDVNALKAALDVPGARQGALGEQAHSLRSSLQNMTATVEGEVLRDSAYIAELGRILGMV